MRRVMIVGMLMAVLVAALTGTAIAQGQGQGQGRGQGEESGQGQGRGQGRGGFDESTFNFKGTVVSTSSDAVVVAVEDGNKKARAFEGQQVSFAVNESTRVERDDTTIAVTELVPDEEVRVQSKAPRDATEFTARKVDVKDD